jgi:hypothetical protein
MSGSARSPRSEDRYAYKIENPPEAIYAYDAFILPEHRVSGNLDEI